MTSDEVFLFARVVLVATFAASALAKARDLDGFHGTLRAFRVAGDRRARQLAPVVLGLEVLVVALTAGHPLTAVPGLGLGAALLAAYTVLLASARARGATIGCNCFGRRATPVSWYDVARNALLLAAALAGLAAGPGTPDLRTAALVVPAGLALVLLAVHLGEVVETLRTPIPIEEAR